MKKTLIAMAALAATGAFAQVTVYGRLEAGYANITTSTTAAGVTTDQKANGLSAHNSASSMWGIKGSEDLGGGMTAGFVLEQDIFPATGVTGASAGALAAPGTFNASGTGGAGTTAFNRTSVVSLSGGFGSITLGRDYNAMFKAVSSTDVNGTSRLSTVNLFSLGTTLPNMITYTTPDISGFKATVNYANQDGSTTAADDKVKLAIISATYANGPLMVVAATGNNVTTAGAAGTSSDSKTEGTVLGATYDFGKVKLFANASTQKATTSTTVTSTESKEQNLGVAVPMGKMTLSAAVGRNTKTSDVGGVTDLSGTDMILGLDYALSARTAVFVKTGTYGKMNGTNAGDTTYDVKSTATAVGIRTSF